MKLFRELSLFFSLLVIYGPSLNAQDFLSLEDIEQSEKINDVDFEDINQLEERIQENKNTYIKPPQKVYKKDKYTPPVFRALLKKNSVITSLKDGETQKVGRNAYVRAQQKNFGDSYTFLLNSEGEWVYRTQTINLVGIERDLDTSYMDLDPAETYQISLRAQAQKEIFHVEHSFTLSLESMRADLYADLLNQSEVSANSTRLEWRGFYKWRLPLEFGLSLNYQDGSYNLGQINWQAFNFGPLVRLEMSGPREDILIKISSGVQKSAYYRANLASGQFYLTALTWHLDFNAVYKTQWGNWIFGLEYRNQNSGIAEDRFGLAADDKGKDSISSLGFVIGQEFSFSL